MRRISQSASFDPRNGRLTLPANFSPYTMSHELSHMAQRDERSLLFRLDIRCQRVPFICRVARFALEVDAARRARIEVRRSGLWDAAARKEALGGLLAYARSMVGFD